MMDQIIEKVLSQGIWCSVAVFFIYHNTKKNNATESFVRDKLTDVVEENSKVLNKVLEKL